jgi:phosphate/sulfate permease
MAEKRIEISTFTFWVICTVGAALITGSGTWAWNMSRALTQNQIDMGRVRSQHPHT